MTCTDIKRWTRGHFGLAVNLPWSRKHEGSSMGSRRKAGQWWIALTTLTPSRREPLSRPTKGHDSLHDAFGANILSTTRFCAIRAKYPSRKIARFRRQSYTTNTILLCKRKECFQTFNTNLYLFLLYCFPCYPCFIPILSISFFYS